MAAPEALYTRRVAGVRMIVAIDSTRRGPALGGCRWKLYPDFASARRDALALAAAMTRKAALARLRLGGGKAVVIGDPATRREEQLLAFGELVELLGGRYLTAADMGTGEAEMRVIARATRHVVGLPRSAGGCGDPAPFTARGVALAIESALAELERPLAGARVAVQGAGAVGSALIALLLEAGASVAASDSSEVALRELPAEVERVEPGAILGLECDVFAPCGPPAVIDAVSAEALRCRVVCGAANNPLAELAIGDRLAQRGILYVPDFVANAGGLIHLAGALDGADDAASLARLEIIRENVGRVLACAKELDASPARAAEQLALAAAAGVDDA